MILREDVYDALKEASVSEEDARQAAREAAKEYNIDFGSVIRSELRLQQWMLVLLCAICTAILVKVW
jgi:hypothetical protein